MNAVHSEYQKNLEQDYWRMRQVKRNLYNSNHPANHFEIGTIETLSNVNRKTLIDFYTDYYSSNMMSLSILSNLDLDTLENLAITYFSQIKNTGKDRIKYPLNYLEEKNTFRLLKVEPVKDVKIYNCYSLNDKVVKGRRGIYKGRGNVVPIPIHHVSHFGFLSSRHVADTIHQILQQHELIRESKDR